MSRHTVPILVATSLLLPVRGFSQSTRHDNVEVIDGRPYKAPDEKRPDLAVVIKFIVDKTNDFRTEQGRPRVAVSEKLTATARDFAAYMARTDRYGHAADGKQPADRAAEHGYEYCIVTENIAYAFDSQGFTTEELGRNFVEGWKDSPGHRRNMLDPDVTETGVGVARSDKTGYYYAVQMFGRPRSLALQFQVVNQSPSTVRYRIEDHDFILPPRYIRTHEQCRPTEVTFEMPAGEKRRTEAFKAADKGRFVIVGDGGMLHVKKG